MARPEGVALSGPIGARRSVAEKKQGPMVLSVHDLALSFGGLRAVDHVSFAIETGRIHGLIGPNGAGKTTIFNCITGFYRPTGGRINFLERDITHLRPDQIARLGIARTFQNVQLFPSLSVLDNVLVAKHSHMRTGVLAEGLGLPFVRSQERMVRDRPWRSSSSSASPTMQRRPAASLPLGFQKRLELARALALEPKLLLLDEPASGLNTSETQALAQMLLRIRERFALTILLVEHDMGLVMNVTRHHHRAQLRPEDRRGDAARGAKRPGGHQGLSRGDRRCLSPSSSSTAIETFYGNIQALKGISFEVPEGSIVTLLGANGAGKSTTLKSISGLVPPPAGRSLPGRADRRAALRADRAPRASPTSPKAANSFRS